MTHSIWIVDFGSQYTQLITRVLRELGFKSEIITVKSAFERISVGEKPDALVLSGGPNSVFEDKEDYSPFFQYQFPVLGICYGMQLMAQYFGANVEKGEVGEYGLASITSSTDSSIPDELAKQEVWMSHSDHATNLPKGFSQIFTSSNDLIAGMKNGKTWGLQFHPEVHHSKKGKQLLRYIFEDEFELKPSWTNQDILENSMEKLKSVGDDYVLCAFSGGVDSLVAAVLAHQSLGDKLYCFFVDHGLLRPQDYSHIYELQKELPLNIQIINAKDYFLNELKGLSDPEDKRKAIGKSFIDIFEEKVKEFEKEHDIHFKYLLQGTLYPDVIESISPHEKDGKSVTIKSHHNVGGLPEKMGLKLLEPFRELFKDEVRIIGKELNLKEHWIHRHPFPGPGLGIRILGELTEEKIIRTQKSDQILLEELIKSGFYKNCWQSLTVYLPIKTVGVKGDGRAYEEVICVRIVDSRDGMTATSSRVPYEVLEKVSSRITNEIEGITRVVYDVTAKPPGTIEWE